MPTQLAHTPRLNKEGLGVVELTMRKVSYLTTIRGTKLMKHLINFALISTTAMTSSIAQASPPVIDYQWAVPPDTCLIRAADAMESVNFKRSGATDSDTEVVGFKGEYKGIIACLGEGLEIAVFIVAGPNYEQAKTSALKMKKNFLK